jgi:hypothetical protein
MLEAVNKDKELRLGIMVKDGKKKHLNASAWGVTDKAQNYMLMMPEFSDLDFAVKQWKSLPTWNPLAQVKNKTQSKIVDNHGSLRAVCGSLRESFVKYRKKG